MTEILRRTITFRGHTPALDSGAATDILEHVGDAKPRSGLAVQESTVGGPAETDNGEATTSARTVIADYEPETDDIRDADTTVFIVTDNRDEGWVDVEFRTSAETVDACLDLLDLVLELAEVRTESPPTSKYLLDVQLILDSHVEPYRISPPDGMLFRMKRTHDGKSALRLLNEEPLTLDDSGDAMSDELDKALSLAKQV